MAHPTPTSLYRLYDEEGVLLYVGIAGNPGRRFEQHRGQKPWWHEVSSMSLEHFDTRDEALIAEKDAIVTEHPLYNRQHSVIVVKAQVSDDPDGIVRFWEPDPDDPADAPRELFPIDPLGFGYDMFMSGVALDDTLEMAANYGMPVDVVRYAWDEIRQSRMRSL